MPTVALSTSWNAHRHSDGYAMLKEAADLGFSSVELSHGTKITLVPGILKAAQEGWIRFSSIHAFCPLPPGASGPSPNLFEPTSPDAEERASWLRYMGKTIEFAQRLQSPVVVLHLGSFRFRWYESDPTHGWPEASAWRSIADGPAAAAWKKQREASLAKLRSKRERFWTPLLECLRAAAPEAKAQGITLGLENREGNNEIPLDADWPELFKDLGEGPWGYWHDTGHAQLKARLGALDVKEHLTRLADRLVGFHCHDVSEEGRDHQGLGAGGIDWDLTRSFWKPHHRFTLELSPRVTREAVLSSREQMTRWLEALPSA